MTAIADVQPWVSGFTPFPDAPVSADPLGFPGYQDQLARARERAGVDESVVCGTGTVAGAPVVVAAFAFPFMGGSMGEATGRRLVAAIDYAAREGIPFVSSVASGGARMQEGMRSLVQMHEVASALVRLRAAGCPHIAVCHHPTTGGVWASMASVSDVTIAIRGATVAFAGARVRGDDGDAHAFTAEGKLESGAVDVVVDADEAPALVSAWVRALSARNERPEPCEPPEPLPGAEEQGTAWGAVELARSADRPRADAYLAAYFDEILELSGDRVSGRDPAMRTGVGIRGGRPIAFIAQTGEANRPAGFRTAVRVLELAERWRLPVLTLIDTPGACNDAQAEAEGIGTAIAQAFAAVAAATVPITTLLIGEGGSGGALAVADPRNMWAVPSSYFSVIAPEGAAAILYRDRDRARELAEPLRLDPAELEDLGIVRGVVRARTSVNQQGAVA